jgi:hypothetical protein
MRPQQLETVRDGLSDLIQIVTVKHGVGPDLPNHQRRPFDEDIGVEAFQFLDRFFAASASIEYIDLWIRISLRRICDPQIHLKPVRIRHDITPARG